MVSSHPTLLGICINAIEVLSIRPENTANPSQGLMHRSNDERSALNDICEFFDNIPDPALDHLSYNNRSKALQYK